MSEILNQALLNQIERLKKVNLEALPEQLENLRKLQINLHTISENIYNDVGEVKQLEWLKEVKEIKVKHDYRHELNLNGWVFGGLLVACVVSVLWGVWAIKGADSAKKEAYFVKEWADFGRYVLQDAQVVSEKTKGKLRAEYNHLRKLNKGELLR